MRITIISPGKFENSPHKAVFENYLKRLPWKVELKELEIKNAKSLEVQKLKNEEEALIVKALKPSSKLIILDEKGKQFSSLAFAKLLENFSINGESDLTFAIGGANGLAENIKNQASLKMSLGLMTLPHLMARTILIEQIYRAYSIINCHPYHRE